jgi:hypothetical protein
MIRLHCSLLGCLLSPKGVVVILAEYCIYSTNPIGEMVLVCSTLLPVSQLCHCSREVGNL